MLPPQIADSRGERLTTAAQPILNDPSASLPARTSSFIKGAGAGYLYQATAMLVGLLLTPFLLHRLGAQDYGLWLVGTQMLGYLFLLDLGVTGLLSREVAYAVGREAGNRSSNDAPANRELPALVGRVIRIAMWQVPLLGMGALAIWLLNPGSWPQLRGPLAIVLAGFVLLFPARVLQGTLAGLQDLGFLNAAQTAAFLATTAITIGLVLMGWRLYSLAIAWIAGQSLLALIWAARVLLRYRYALPRRLLQVRWPEARQYLGKSTWVTVTKIGDVLLSGTDLLLVGRFLGPGAVIAYACTGKLLLVLSNQPQMLMELALPGLSHMRFAESRERTRQAFTALSQGMLLMTGAIVSCVLLLNRSFVSWWVGKDLYAGTLLTALLIASLLLRHWNLTLSGSVFCLGYERRIGIQTLTDGVVSVVSAIVLLHFLGPIGVPLGNIAGACIVSVPASLRVLSREMNTSIPRLLAPLASWAVRMAVMLTAGSLLARSYMLHRFPLMALAGAACLIVYAALMAPLALRPPLSVYLRPLFGRLKRAAIGA